MLKQSTVQLMALGLVGSFAATAAAQDSGALIDALVRKGVLKDQEAEQIRSQLSRDYAANTPAGKLNISSSVKELKLSGDVRLRYQYDDAHDAGTLFNGTGSTNNGANQRSRYRLRLRVNADYKLADDFFAGFGLQTTQNNDSGNQTMGGGTAGDYNQNYGIFISKAFLGWTPISGVTLIGGKQANPFYTTDMLWDADISPTGFTQRFDLHKIFGFSGLELSLVGGEFVLSDNTESGAPNATLGHKTVTDAFAYQVQLIAASEIVEGVKLTVAPGIYTTNTAALAATTSDGGGEFNSSKWSTKLDQLQGLKLALLPGDVSFKVAGKPVKFLWDLAWNADGKARAALYNKDMSGKTPASVTAASPVTVVHSERDDWAYLAGFQFGENKKKGDLSFMANYRVVGLASVDPNINDSDWALSYTNMQGPKVGFLYSLGDATTVGATYYSAQSLRKDLGAGHVSAGPGSQRDNVQVLQVDMSVKF